MENNTQQFSFKVDADSAGKRIDVFCLDALKGEGIETSRQYVQQLMKEGRVKVGGTAHKAHFKVKNADLVEISYAGKPARELIAEEIPLNIMYEDKDVIVINKPSGLVVHPAPGNYEGTLVNALLFRYPDGLSRINPLRPGIVHRLDKETSGVMLAARNDNAHIALARQFSRHTISRKYVAVVGGKVEFDEGLIDLPIGRDKNNFRKMKAGFLDNTRPAQTRYRTLKRTASYSVLEISPKTGRTHQIRVHLAHMGHPVLGDKKYGSHNTGIRLMLHARYIGFNHPRTGEFLEFDSALPEEFSQFINK
ncbi:MAG: RluA family pseudouridine synthase [Candidatus Omnitrophica bacterium]|nr:RluA family pseudouridine synthase [Candidatus Omnitrophota bacterium]